MSIDLNPVSAATLVQAKSDRAGDAGSIANTARAADGKPGSQTAIAGGLGVIRIAFQAAKGGEVALAFAVMVILVILILPMPAWMLDFFLAISIIFSVLVLMTALFIREPLEFSSFPTVLLIATMLRLALNLASTRLILAEGHTSTKAAGSVIEAFGSFVMGGNAIIGVIVFSILVIVNFVVITKGSGRIAEVAARFTLDAMPGKQMAIDADLSAGLIDEDEARRRRRTLEDESAFFGAMDGASKFVRGDAIAGLLITFINIIGGIVIGVAQMELGFGDAAGKYSLLTIGDGLVSQIPALIVSTAAGLLVSKAGVRISADKALSGQLTSYPKALGLSAVIMVILSVLPGMPMPPFLLLAGISGWYAWHIVRQNQARDAAKVQASAQETESVSENSEALTSEALKIDALRIEIGYALLELVNGAAGEDDQMSAQIRALRQQIAGELGVVMPAVRILDNVQLAPNEYVIKIKEVDAGKGMLYPQQFMVMDPNGEQINLPGTHTSEPTFGLPATWVDLEHREDAALLGYTVVDPATVLMTHLTEILKANISDLLTYSEVSKLLEELPAAEKKLVEDIVPSQISIVGIQKILQLLLNERVSIRDLTTILEGIADAGATARAPAAIMEEVRMRLSRQICAANLNEKGELPLIALSPLWEKAFIESIIGEEEDRRLTMAPSKLQEFVGLVRAAFDAASEKGEVPVLLTSAHARPFVRSIIERFRAHTCVMSQGEIHPKIRLRTVGTV